MLGGKKRGRPTKRTAQKQALQLPLEWLFKLPYFTGYGEHWPLLPEEASILTDQLLAAADTLPGSAAKQIDRLLKFLETIFPWGALVATAYALTAPRLALTRQLLDQRKAAADGQQHGNGARSNGGPAGSAAPAAAGDTGGGSDGTPGSASPVVRDIFAGQ